MGAGGYKTSAECVVETVFQGRPARTRSRLIDIAMDSASILSELALSVGSLIKVSLSGYQMDPMEARVVANHGDSGFGYRVDLKLKHGCWPYEAFVELTAIAQGSTGSEDVATPPCFLELDLRLPCTVQDVEAAWRTKVAKAHPDRGGDLETFVKLRGAYLEALDLLGAKR